MKLYTILLESRGQNDSNGNGSLGAIIGGAIAAAVVFIIIILLLSIGIWYRRRSKQKQTSFPVANSVHGNAG